MIVHVASHSEAKGSVVLRISRDLSPAALRTASRIARAYDAEIDAVLIEDENLFTATAYPFAREISPNGRFARRLDAKAVAVTYDGLGRRVSRLLADLTKQHDVRTRFRCVRGEPDVALARACAENGPWNVIVMAEPFSEGPDNAINDLFQRVPDATGIVLVGDRATAGLGAIVALVEQAEYLPPMLRIADRLGGNGLDDVSVLPILGDDDEGRRLDGDLRLALAVDEDVGRPTHGLLAPFEASDGVPALTRRLVGLGPGLIIARAGGVLAGQAKPLAELLRLTGATLFLTRD